MSGTYAFTVGSTATARPTLNITGLAVRNTDANGMRINANTARGDDVHALRQHRVHGGDDQVPEHLRDVAVPVFERLFVRCHRCGGALPTNNVTLTGNGTADGETRACSARATCHANQTTNGYCNDSWTIDDDANNDGVGDRRRRATKRWCSSFAGRGTDTAGTVEGFPTAAFDWNTFAYYSTYVAFHDVSGTVDRVYVRTQAGAAKYSWTRRAASRSSGRRGGTRAGRRTTCTWRRRRGRSTG